MYLLDTDILTHLQKGNAKVAKRLQQLSDPNIAITIITKAEVLSGRIAYLLKAATNDDILRAQKLLRQSENALAQLRIIGFDDEAAAHFDRLRAVQRLRRVGHADMLIASITLANRATLVTRNVKHFQQFPNLKIENWM